MEKLTLLDSPEVCRRTGLTESQFRYLVRKFPDLIVPCALAVGRFALWDPCIIPVILQCRASLNLKTWEKRRAKIAEVAAARAHQQAG